MNEIFVTNYFTKEKLLSEMDMKELEQRCVEGIAEVLRENEGTDYRTVGDAISDKLQTLGLEFTPEYTKLPVSSLLDHLKTTAAIAVSLAINRGYSDEVDKIRISALLHDIGKIRVFSSIEKEEKPSFTTHVRYTEEILKKIGDKGISNINSPLGEFWKRIVSIAPRHHTPDYYKEYQANTELHRVVADADSIASAANRSGDLKFDDSGNIINDSPFSHYVIIGGEKFCMMPGESQSMGGNEKADIPTLHGELKVPQSKNQIFRDKLGLLYMDIHGIQRFIGESKKLLEISGASYIIEKVISEEAKMIVSKYLSTDNIVYIGGGNMVVITPFEEGVVRALKNDLIEMISDISRGGLSASISYKFFDASAIASDFGKCVEECKRLEVIGETPLPEVRLNKSSELCKHCGSREATREVRGDRVCEVCFTKYEYGRNNTTGPKDLKEIGESIAIVVADGNMMGRLFAQSKTPTDYAFKSRFVKKRIGEIVRGVLPDKSRLLYVGGDDIMFIVDAKNALKVTKTLINEVAEEFRYSPAQEECMGTPMITLSAGISIADHKFPVYFLIEKAKKLETSSKEEFRKKAVNKSGLFILPKGSLSFSVVSSSMPSERNFTFILPDREIDLSIIQKFVERVTGGNREKWRSFVSLIINGGTKVEDRLNLIKFLYSKISDKDIIMRAADSEGMSPIALMEETSKVLVEDELLLPIDELIPMVWHSGNDFNGVEVGE